MSPASVTRAAPGRRGADQPHADAYSDWNDGRGLGRTKSRAENCANASANTSAHHHAQDVAEWSEQHRDNGGRPNGADKPTFPCTMKQDEDE